MFARRKVPMIHIRSASSISLPHPRPTPTADSFEGAESDVEAVVGNSLALEPLASALEGGWTATEWIGREQVKFWTLQEKTAKLLRSLHRDYAFDQLVSDAKDLYRTRREALVRLDAASRRGDEHTLREENDKVTQIDSELSQNLAQRDAWTDWKVYVELNRRIDERVKEMRRMWEEQERVPFDNAWKGHFGDRL